MVDVHQPGSSKLNLHSFIDFFVFGTLLNNITRCGFFSFAVFCFIQSWYGKTSLPFLVRSGGCIPRCCSLSGQSAELCGGCWTSQHARATGKWCCVVFESKCEKSKRTLKILLNVGLIQFAVFEMVFFFLKFSHSISLLFNHSGVYPWLWDSTSIGWIWKSLEPQRLSLSDRYNRFEFWDEGRKLASTGNFPSDPVGGKSSS